MRANRSELLAKFDTIPPIRIEIMRLNSFFTRITGDFTGLVRIVRLVRRLFLKPSVSSYVDLRRIGAVLLQLGYPRCRTYRFSLPPNSSATDMHASRNSSRGFGSVTPEPPPCHLRTGLQSRTLTIALNTVSNACFALSPLPSRLSATQSWDKNSQHLHLDHLEWGWQEHSWKPLEKFLT